MKISELLNESSLTRILGKTKSRSVGIITAWRGSNSYKENVQLNKKLVAFLMDKGYSVTSVDGSYIEQFDTPQAEEVSEQSLFVSSPIEGDDNGALEELLIKLGEKFDQDSILSFRFGGKPTLIGTSTRPDSYPGMGNREEFSGNMEFGRASGPFFSRVKDRPFAFTESVEWKYPDTINGIRVMKRYAQEIDTFLKS